MNTFSTRYTLLTATTALMGAWPAHAADSRRESPTLPNEPVRTEAEARLAGPGGDNRINPFGPAGRQNAYENQVSLSLEFATHEMLYVSQGSGGQIFRIDPVTYAVSTIVQPEAGNFECLAASADEGRLYAGSQTTASVYAFDLESGKLLESAPLPDAKPGVPAYPAAMALPPGGGRLYIGDISSSAVEVRDAADLSSSYETFLALYAGNGHALAFAPNSLDLYVGGFSSTSVGVRTPHVDLQTGQLWHSWGSVPFGMTGGGQQGTMGFGWLEAQGLFVVGNVSKDVLLLIDSNTGAAVDYMATEAMPFRLAVSPHSTADKGLIYVPTAQGWTLDVYEVHGQGAGATLSLAARIDAVCMDEGDAAEAPSEVVFSEERDEAYVLCSHRIRVIDTLTHQIVHTIPLSPTAMSKDILIVRY